MLNNFKYVQKSNKKKYQRCSDPWFEVGQHHCMPSLEPMEISKIPYCLRIRRYYCRKLLIVGTNVTYFIFISSNTFFSSFLFKLRLIEMELRSMKNSFNLGGGGNRRVPYRLLVKRVKVVINSSYNSILSYSIVFLSLQPYYLSK